MLQSINPRKKSSELERIKEIEQIEQTLARGRMINRVKKMKELQNSILERICEPCGRRKTR